MYENEMMRFTHPSYAISSKNLFKLDDVTSDSIELHLLITIKFCFANKLGHYSVKFKLRFLLFV